MMLGQLNIRRLLAYSSIHNFGYIFLVFSLTNFESIIVCLVFLFYYLFIVLSILFLLNLIKSKINFEFEAQNFNMVLENLFSSQKDLAYALSIFLFLLLGIPPGFGFFIKGYVLLLLVEGVNFFLLDIFFIICILIFFSLISVGVYLHLLSLSLFNYLELVNLERGTFTILVDKNSFLFLIGSKFEFINKFIFIFLGLFLLIVWCFFNPNLIFSLFRYFIIFGV